MTITTEHMQALRTFFRDPDKHSSQMDRLTANEDLDGYWAMVAATLVVLGGRRFTDADRASEVIRWVARTRARLARMPGLSMEVNAEAAEQLLGVILGETETSEQQLQEIDPTIRGETHFLLLGLLYEDVGRPDLEQLLTEARTVATAHE